MNTDRVTFSSCVCVFFVKCTCFTGLTRNRSANKLSAVANIVLCAQCTSLRPLSLWPCTWTLTVCFLLQANQTDVCDSFPIAVGYSSGSPGSGAACLHKMHPDIELCSPWWTFLLVCFHVWIPFVSYFIVSPLLICRESLFRRWLSAACTSRPLTDIEWCVPPSCGQLKQYILQAEDCWKKIQCTFVDECVIFVSVCFTIAPSSFLHNEMLINV